MKNSTIGSFALVLHSHLPYVISHGRWPHGTDWLNEAAAETYIPLLNMLNGLVEQGYSPKVTMSITPVLTEQLASETFKGEFLEYVGIKIKAAEDNAKEFRERNELHKAMLAERWQDFYSRIRSDFESRYDRDLVKAFRELQDAGHIEIITCAATHGYLPLLSQDMSVQAQIKQGVATYEKYYGRRPRGIWLPECAYRPRYEWSPPENVGGPQPYMRKGVEEFLAENGVSYFIVDSHLLQGGEAIGNYLARFKALQRLWDNFAKSTSGSMSAISLKEDQTTASTTEGKSVWRPHLVSSHPNHEKSAAFFARDAETASQVWSGDLGYPGDGWYLDFHKKHFPGGHRYWRVTDSSGDMGAKQEYQPEMIEERITENANHFVGLVKDILKRYNQTTGEHGVLCAPFDAELYGHWWFEGPQWLGAVLKAVCEDTEIQLTTCSDYLTNYPPNDLLQLPEGSWGEGGFHWIWLNEWTEWTWKYIYEAEERMIKLARENLAKSEDGSLACPHDERLPVNASSMTAKGDGRTQTRRILCQLARELLLLQSSDWQFLISTWSARDYAEKRVLSHYQRFDRLAQMAQMLGRGESLSDSDWAFLEHCEETDALFKEVDPAWWVESGQ